MSFQYPDAVIMLFCKALVPGQVKTRLMVELTAEQAANTHIELSSNTLKLAVGSGLCPVQLWCAPSTEHAFFRLAASGYNLMLKQQAGEELGVRMFNAFVDGLQHYRHALLMGCDCPSLTEQDLHQALIALSGQYDTVLAPTEDGGYGLLGMNQPHIGLFTDIPWSTPSVLTLTRERITSLQLRSFELPEQWDVDTPADWLRYCRSKLGD